MSGQSRNIRTPKSFSDNFCISKRRALVAEADEGGTDHDIDQLVDMADDVPVQARELHKNWLNLLVDHYGSLLTCRGRTYLRPYTLLL